MAVEKRGRHAYDTLEQCPLWGPQQKGGADKGDAALFADLEKSSVPVTHLFAGPAAHGQHDPGWNVPIFDAMPSYCRDVDPRELRLPPSRSQGADLTKLASQISLFGASMVGMPPPWVYEGSDGVFVVYNGVTRATRIAKLVPGTLIRVEVIGQLPKAFAADPKIGDFVP